MAFPPRVGDDSPVRSRGDACFGAKKLKSALKHAERK